MADAVANYLNLPNTYNCIHNTISKKILHGRIFSLSKLKNIILYKIFARFVYRNSNVICVSDGTRHDFKNLGYKENSCRTIYNPFNFSNIRSRSLEYQVEEKNYIIHVGRFDIQKRHDILLKAYKKSKISENLMLIGDYNNPLGKKTLDMIIRMDLEKRVILKGTFRESLSLHWGCQSSYLKF